jgi:hypothetical protein
VVWAGVVTLLLGLAKQGKTYLDAQFALCLASGRQILGLDTQPARVLYMSWEITLAGLLSRMQGIARDCGLPDPEPLLRDGSLLFYAHSRDATVEGLNLGGSEDWPRFRQLLDDVKPDVVVIDTLRKACPEIDLKDDQGWSSTLSNFNALARETGISLVLVDHGHRGRTGDTAASFAMGSQVKGSELPCIVKLERRREEDEPDRWSVEVDSWFDDPGTPIWYERPEIADGERGSGCVPCEAPAAPTKKADTTVEIEKWLRERLGDQTVSSELIYREACREWWHLEEKTLKRKLRRALHEIGGGTEDVKGSKVRQTVWFL